MSFVLHPHQQSALDMLRSSLMAGHRRPMLQASTGFGKTILAAVIVSNALAKGKRVVFTVPSISLIDQTVEKLRLNGITCVGVMQGDHPGRDDTQPVQVATVQTLESRGAPRADLVLIDEAHIRYDFVSKWMRQAGWQTVPFIGLSATPWSRGLGLDYDDLLVSVRMSELIERGFLSPFRVFAPSHPDLSKVRTLAGDYHEGDLSEAMSQPTLIADAVGTWLRLGEGRPTLCFAVDRAHARRLQDGFEGAGVPADYVDMNTPREEREAIGRRLADGRVRVVCNVGTLTTGVDWDVRCISLVRPTKSEMLYTQIVGRGLRTADGKTDCIILDHSDTTSRLGFVSDIHHDKLDDGKPRKAAQQKREKPTPLPKECPKCTRLKPAGIRKCPSCGFEPERQSAIQECDGELVAIRGREKGKAKKDPTPHSEQEFFSMLVWWAERHEKKDSWISAKFKSRFGYWPRGLRFRTLPADTAFSNWLRYDTIRWAKSQKNPATEGAHAGA